MRETVPLSGVNSDEMWTDVIDEVDIDGDGQVSSIYINYIFYAYIFRYPSKSSN